MILFGVIGAAILFKFYFFVCMRCFPFDIFISFVFPRAVGLFVCFSRRCRLTVTKGANLSQLIERADGFPPRFA